MAAMRKERNKMSQQNPLDRAKNFHEVALGFSLEEAKTEADRCLNCKNAPCKSGCPVGVNIPEFLSELKNGNIENAGNIIKGTNSLPSVCGRVCPQEIQCEKLCLRAKMEGAVSIGSCERFVGDYMLKLEEKNKSNYNKDCKTENSSECKNTKKVAVIGSGPAGLSCAASLADNGVEVTVFESLHKLGGVLTYGIPEFRLPKNIVESEINTLKNKNVKFEINTVIGKTITLKKLKEEFDAIFIGSGAGLPVFLNISGENYNGVYSANEFLTRVNLMKAYDPNCDTPVKVGENVAVIGAGNVAMDAARTALRLGAKSVTLVYRRSREEMPARDEEIEHAIEEGIKLELLCAPIEINGENGWAKSITCEKMCLGEPDSSNRRSPVKIENSEFELKADMIIIALGTSPNPLLINSYKDIKVSSKGTILVDENLQTSVTGIYAGGDAVTGAATVILAMGAGRKASESILKQFKG